MNASFYKILPILVIIFSRVVWADEGQNRADFGIASFALIVNVKDENGRPLQGVAVQQVGVEVEKAIKFFQGRRLPKSASQFNRASLTSTLGIAALGVSYVLVKPEPGHTLDPGACEIMVSAAGYATKRVRLSSVPVERLDVEEEVHAVQISLQKLP